ncbi:MAG: LytTR family transcriptional regulator [Eubacterium sp.]|nr:LytTR family transcriptional regulator [Eubacterium sp.]
MKLFIRDKLSLAETEVEIRCSERNEEVENLINAVKSAGETLIGEKENGDKTPVYISRVLYFEAVDRNVFAYTTSEIFRIKKTLYDLEDAALSNFFARISKSVIVNLKAVQKIAPDSSRRLRLLLRNGEWVIVSRNFVNDFKNALGMKGGI